MEIDKKNRTDLKGYFVANNIPTQGDFEDLIDAQLNQVEDGISKVEGNPIALQAEGDVNGPQEVLALYGQFTDENPDWSINLNPRVDPEVPNSNKPGLNVKNAAGESRLYIDSESGKIGLGTIEPNAGLAIQAKDNQLIISVISKTTGSANIFEVSQEENHGQLTLGEDNGNAGAKLSGDPGKNSFVKGKMGVGTNNPEAILHVDGSEDHLLISSNEGGIPPKIILRNFSEKGWEISGQDGGDSLELMPTANPANKITFRQSGGFKIKGKGGASGPDGTLHLGDDRLMFGGSNDAANHMNSAQISTGREVQNSLNIHGMTDGSSSATRRVDMWAEAGFYLRGKTIIPEMYAVSFSASLNSDMTGSKNPMVFGHVHHNSGGHFKDKKQFIAPVKGIYLFTMSLRGNTESDVIWYLRLNNSGYVNGIGSEPAERSRIKSRLHDETATRTIIAKLNKGDKVHVQQSGGGTDNYSSGFDGTLLQALM